MTLWGIAWDRAVGLKGHAGHAVAFTADEQLRTLAQTGQFDLGRPRGDPPPAKGVGIASMRLSKTAISRDGSRIAHLQEFGPEAGSSRY